MTKTTLFATIETIALPIISSLGLALWGMELLQSGRPVLRIYVDTSAGTKIEEKEEDKKQEDATGEAIQDAEKTHEPLPDTLDLLSESAQSVSINQCAHLSRLLSLALEVEDIFPSAYTLEVSSPGLSRPFFHLEQLQGYGGETIDVILATPLTHDNPACHGRKKFRGTLQAVHTGEERFSLFLEASEALTIDIPWHAVRKATRVHIFPIPQKPGKKKQ